MVHVLNSEGQRIALRAILDSASESSFISNEAATVLSLKKEKANIPICGLGDSPLRVKKFASARVSNYKNDCNWAIKLLIVPKIADAMPADLISRGLEAPALSHCELWWKGPELTSIPVPASDEPQPADQQFFEELKVLPKMAFSSHNISFFDFIIDRSNNYYKLLRILSYVLRFFKNALKMISHAKLALSQERNYKVLN
ncbi:hypothetical protein JTE90_028198 [Oedothorax gibbosus]|uniref:Peptidase aspartic putative domain-containing protein n=1 Tax=Oedothorax gibbosus TaxID=931172 RepID=A0AAV6TP52_9ARAC|nr:hypothetical protein JTE90_028198 [Oedothorax gibbosus]